MLFKKTRLFAALIFMCSALLLLGWLVNDVPLETTHPETPNLPSDTPEVLPITGYFKVVDGDTGWLSTGATQEFKCRLDGIDTPEFDQFYGKKSTAALKALIPSNTLVKVKLIEQDKYDRWVSRIYVNGVDINLKMVEQGHARVHPYYCKEPAFFAAEKQAKQERRGLWQYKTIPPWLYRRGVRQENLQSALSNPFEVIITAKNQWQNNQIVKWLYAITVSHDQVKVYLAPFDLQLKTQDSVNSATMLVKKIDISPLSLMGEGVFYHDTGRITCYTEYYFSYYSDGQDILATIIASRLGEYLNRQVKDNFYHVDTDNWVLRSGLEYIVNE